jgi:DNA-binding NtrC family response regulator
MSQPVLLASRDSLLLSTRTSLLRRAGFMTLRIQDLGALASMARFNGFRMVVLDHTISPEEQQAVIKKLQEFSALFHIICIQTKGVPSQALIRKCKVCSEDDLQGGVHLLDEQIAFSE